LKGCASAKEAALGRGAILEDGTARDHRQGRLPEGKGTVFASTPTQASGELGPEVICEATPGSQIAISACANKSRHHQTEVPGRR
jgi:hypothetical protein